MKTCLNCQAIWDILDETCPECECPYANEDFTDQTGETQDRALRHWFESEE